MVKTQNIRTNDSRLPNFLIVGAAKSGTTSLYHYLRQHPEIFLPAWKEPQFFIDDSYCNLHRIKSWQTYRSLFRKAGTKKIGEASTSYLYDRASPLLIKEYLDGCKIIIILRDPVTAAYSLYHHKLRRDGESSTSFEQALMQEDQRYEDPGFRRKCYGYHATYYYFRFYLYSEQVARYLQIFGRERVKIFLYDDLITNPVAVTQEAYRFLDVDDTFFPKIKIHNPAGTIISIPRFWSDYGLFIQTLQFIFSNNLLKKIPLLIRNAGRKPPSMLNLETEKILRCRFHDDICKLERLIQRDLSHWKVTHS